MLAKLQDDKDMLYMDGITEQNVIRAVQINPPKKNVYSELEWVIHFYHDRNKHGIIKNMLRPNTDHLPVLHTAVRWRGKKHLTKPYGVYSKTRLSDLAEFIFPHECDVYNQSDNADVYIDFTRDPRYNPAIHGSEGVVWFKFSHQADFDAGPNGQGSTWMYLKDARSCKNVESLLLNIKISQLKKEIDDLKNRNIKMSK